MHLTRMTPGERSGIGSPPLAAEIARRDVVERFNATQASYPLEKLIHELYEDQVRDTPGAVAVLHEARSITYAELNGKANQLARYLIGKGVRPDQPIAICVERSLEMVIGLLGILKSGGAYLPLDPNYPVERLKYMLQDAAPRVVLTQSRLRGALSETRAEVIELDTEGEQFEVNRAENIPAGELGLATKNLLYVIYTSGSTGQPKGIAMPHRSMANLIEWHRRTLPCGGQRALQTAALSFDVSFQEIFSTLCTGGTLVLVDECIRRDASALSDLVRRQAVDRLFIPPLMLQAMAESFKSSGVAPRSLKDIIVAGEQLRISAEIVDFFNGLDGCRLHNHYGPTETHAATSLTLVGPPETWPALPPIGRPLANVQIYVLDAQCQPVSVGEVGEIYIGGTGLARGYLNRPELTAQRFVENPFSAERSAHLYRTGDLGRWQSDGVLEYLGRNDQQVKIRGYRIELGEIETRLARHPQVTEAAVVVREASAGDKRLVAYVATRDGHDPQVAELRAFVREELPEYMVPSAYVRVERWPLSPNGKLDRAALPAPDSSAYVQREYEPPTGAVEVALATIWQTVLNVDRVGRGDNFFDLGGDSLLAMRAASRIRQRWSTDFSSGEIFHHPTLRALADSIADAEACPLPVVPIADRNGALPLSFAQQRMWFLCQLKGVNETYNMACGLRLYGGLDLTWLQAGLNRIVERHEVLRTVFVPHEGGVVQVVLPRKGDFDLVTHDLRGRADAQSELQRAAACEASEPFDLQHGPLCRGRLVRLAEEEHVLLLTMHHIVSDGWSMAVLLSELSKLYDAFRRGAADPLLPLPIQYADYAMWQREGLSDERLRRQRDYWQRTLQAAPTLSGLPTDHPRPAVQNYRGAELIVVVNSALTRRLRALGKHHGTTLFMTLMAGWAATLSRLSAQSDLVIGMPTANRSLSDSEDLIGLFVNTLALRIDLTGSPTVSELLRRVKGQMLAAQSNADIGFEQVVEVVKPVRSTAHSPIFQVLMAWQNMPVTIMELPGLRLEPLTVPSPFSKFDLSLSLAEEDDHVAGAINFSTSLFERDTVNRYIECWQAVLQGMVDDDGQQVDRLILPVSVPGLSETATATDAPVVGLSVYEAPLGEMEIAISNIWIQILGVNRVGRRDNFFALGGTSLQLLMVMNRIMDVLELSLSLESLYSSVSLAELARHAADARSTASANEYGVI
jgi:amino acid adenylation domain-containing protein